MTSIVVYEGGLRTTCTHLRSGSDFETLATCMVTVMGIKARTMGFDLNDVKVEVEKIMKADPRRVAGINLSFHIPDALAAIDVKTRDILKHTGNTCPVQKSIHPDIEVKVNWGSWN
jgi:uncharacterized OsmC-like protein